MCAETKGGKKKNNSYKGLRVNTTTTQEKASHRQHKHTHTCHCHRPSAFDNKIANFIHPTEKRVEFLFKLILNCARPCVCVYVYFAHSSMEVKSVNGFLPMAIFCTEYSKCIFNAKRAPSSCSLIMSLYIKNLHFIPGCHPNSSTYMMRIPKIDILSLLPGNLIFSSIYPIQKKSGE